MGLREFSGSFINEKIQQAGDSRGFDIQMEAVRFEPAGLLSLSGVIVTSKASQIQLVSLESIECTFRPFDVFLGTKVTPRCLVTKARSVLSMADLLRLLKEPIMGPEGRNSSKVSEMGLKEYMAPPDQWTLATSWEVQLGEGRGTGQMVYEPKGAPFPAHIRVTGTLSMPSTKEERPFALEAKTNDFSSLKTAQLFLPDRLLLKDFGNIPGAVSLGHVEVTERDILFHELRAILWDSEFYAQGCRVQDADSIISALKTAWMKGALPASIEMNGGIGKFAKGMARVGHIRMLTSDVGTSLRMKEVELHPEQENLLLKVPEISLTAVSRKDWKTDLPKSELRVQSPTLFWSDKPEDTGDENQRIEDKAFTLLTALLQRTQPEATGDVIQDAGSPGSSILLSQVGLLPAVIINDGSVVMSGPQTEDEKAPAIGGISARWTRDGDEGSFECSATLSPEQRKAAATISGSYDLLKKRVTHVKFRTANTLFPRLLSAASEKFVVEDDATVGVTLDMDLSHPSLWHLKGDLDSQGIGFNWWRIGPMPVEDLSFKSSLDASFDRLDRRLTVNFPDLQIHRAKAAIKLVVENLGASPFLRLNIDVPKQPCSYAFGAIPDAMIPRLSALRVAGDLEMGLSMKLNSTDPYSLKLDIQSDLESCTVLRLGDNLSMGQLRDPSYIHRPYVEGEELSVEVGPGSASWTPYYRIPSYVSMAAVATEDLDFFVHEGFKVSLIRRAMKLNLDKQRYVYGGSTISQQLVKNLFLSREKNLSRKLEEAILTWQMEREIDKIRILELYLNCIEYGPGIYGIANGAAHYFQKPVESLTPLEGAFLMGLKPCPSCGFRQWRRKGVNKRWQSKLEFIMNRLFKRGWITEEQFMAEAPYRPSFASAEDLEDIIAP